MRLRPRAKAAAIPTEVAVAQRYGRRLLHLAVADELRAQCVHALAHQQPFLLDLTDVTMPLTIAMRIFGQIELELLRLGIAPRPVLVGMDAATRSQAQRAVHAAHITHDRDAS